MQIANSSSAMLLILFTSAIFSTHALDSNTASSEMANDYRFVSHAELQPTLDVFAPANVTRFSEILFDIQKYQIIVGARDQLYRLSVRGLQELESAHWPADNSSVNMCEIKGQTSVDCHNFVRVLHRHGSSLLACGTYAFQPVCTWRRLDALNAVQRRESGKAMAPYSPHLNVTSVLSSEGEVFAATPTDFSGQDPAVYGRQNRLRTPQYDSRLLSAPDFVGSFEAGEFVYFVFREDAVEYMSCGKAVYSRIARVCKNDRGNNGRHVWTTFVKARLNCSMPGEYLFYLDEVQSIHYLDREEVLYATFTTPENSLAGSAVCAFNMSAINAAFQGPFQHQSPSGGPWQQVQLEDHTHFECRSPNVTSGHQLAALSEYSLTAEAVQPERPEPLLLLDGVRLTSVAADVTTTKHHVSVHVLYVADTAGAVRKLSVVPRSRKTCLLEVLEPFDKPTRVLTMKLLREAASLYLGTDSGLVRLPVQRCGRYRSEAACLAAMDPYCGWDEARALCTMPPGYDPGVASWHQLVTQCPNMSQPVDGGWSAWADWQPCRQVGEAGAAEDGEPCLCRRRQCTSPSPARGGAPCAGLAAEVTNCTRHGGWTSWSAWSACSHPCGVAIKSRRRSCSSPAPAHGGKDCGGDAEQSIMCHANPPCPSETNLPVDGGWGDWSVWSRCSARCGGGLRQRRRACDSPRPANGGRACVGCDTEYGECGGEPCPEQRRLTHWTPWLAANGSTAGRQQRFRFECRAPVPEAGLIRVSHARSDERYCSADGECTPADWTGLSWGDWSVWSPCSMPCGGGVQTRSRTCDGQRSACLGPSRVERACNTHRCKGDWSCWSEWSECSESCGVGRRRRLRQCRPPDGADPSDVTCDGSDVTEQACEMPSCSSLEGWNEWSVWSECDTQGAQHRIRDCMVSEPGEELCQGQRRQSRLCVETNDESILLAATAAAAPGVSAGRLVGACLGCFLAGGLLAAVATYYYLHRRRYGRVPGSKYYDTLPKPAAPNAYVTVRGVPAVPGVHELAELRGNRGRHSSGKTAELVQPEKTATIRRNGSQRYTPVSGTELRVNLASDNIY